MQNNIVMAFRKRLKNRGYTDVSIYKMFGNEYDVQCREPLTGAIVQRRFTLTELHRKFKKETAPDLERLRAYKP